VLHDEAALHIINHLRYGNGLLIHIQDGSLAHSRQDVLKDTDKIDGIGSNLLIQPSLLALIAAKVLQAGIAPGRLFNLLLLEQHLRSSLESFVFEEALDQ